MTSLPVRAGLFCEEPEPRLLGSRCDACGRPHFPRAATCPYCSSRPCEEVLLSAVGRLWAWTAVNVAPPGYRGEVPYGFGIVELPEGLRVITRLTESDPASLAEGQQMRMVLVALHRDDEGREVLTYAFAPEGER